MCSNIHPTLDHNHGAVLAPSSWWVVQLTYWVVQGGTNSGESADKMKAAIAGTNKELSAAQ